MVSDSTGRPLAGVRIVIRSLDTGLVRSADTSGDGRYRIAALELGLFQVLAERDGFERSGVQAIRLEAGKEAWVEHMMRPATFMETVTVAASGRLVETSAAALTGFVRQASIEQLPLNGRDFMRMALLQPGVHAARARPRNLNTGNGIQLSLSGSRPIQNSFRLDGVSVSDQSASTPGSSNGLNLGVDTLREFLILNSTYGAEYGRSAGGVISAVTRSGTNDLHGSMSYFHRNDNLDARNFFDPADPPEFRRHQLGATAGGRVVRDRTFYFAGYEGLRQLRGNTASNTTISDAARRGILRLGAPVSTDPAIARLLELYPSPNSGTLGDTGLFVFSNEQLAREDYATTRFDHSLNEKNPLFLRYSINDANRSELTAFAVGRSRNRTRQQSMAAEHTYLASAAFTNTLRFGLSRAFSVNSETQALSPAADDPTLVFVPGRRAIGRVDVAGLTLFPGGTRALDFDRTAYTTFQLYNDANWSRGRHWLRMGAAVERSRFNLDSQNIEAGEYRFPSLRDFLQNRPDRFRAQLPGSDTIRGFRQWLFAWYLQDRWRVLPRLTLDLGIRHEWITVPTEAQGKIANLDELTSTVMRTSGPLFENPSFKVLQPRAGFAWDVRGNGATVIRGGYGIYQDQFLSHYLLIAGVRNPPFYLAASIVSLEQGDLPANGYRRMVSRPTIDLRAERLPRRPGQPYVQQWNFHVQQRITAAISARAAYAGSHGLHLSQLQEDANIAASVVQPDGRLFFPPNSPKINPVFGTIRDRIFEGQSFYNSAQFGLERRADRGPDLGVSYTYSRSIDDDSNSFSQSEYDNAIGIPVNGNSRFNRGLSNFDLRHNFTVHANWMLKTGPVWLRRWRVGSIVTAASGHPFSATLAYDAARTRTSRSDRRSGQRPDLRPGFSNNPVTGNPNRWFDPGAFARPANGYLGNLGRNTLIGPGLFSVDAIVARQWSIEKVKVEFRAEAFNVTNRANFDLPLAERMQVFNRDSVREDAGRITSAGAAREFQFGIRVVF